MKINIDVFKPLLELQEEAKNNSNKVNNKFFIRLNTGRKLIGKFIDPFLGVMVFDELPSSSVYVKDLIEFDPEGIFLELDS